MNQTEANALLVSIIANAAGTDDGNFSYHAIEGVHMSKTQASARALADPTNLCGYFQHEQVRITTIKTDAEGWDLPPSGWIKRSTPTGLWENVSEVEYVRLVKAFFRTGQVIASPNRIAELATMRGPIPRGFSGYTNVIGTANYFQVTNMQAIIRKGRNWQLVTIYPVA